MRRFRMGVIYDVTQGCYRQGKMTTPLMGHFRVAPCLFQSETKCKAIDMTMSFYCHAFPQHDVVCK